MNKCITPEPTKTSAPLSSSSREEQSSPSPSPAGITITQPSPRQTRKRRFINEACTSNEDHKKSLSPITATSCSRKRQRRKEPTVRFASAPHQTHVVPRWTEDEAASSWYSKYDIFAFKHQELIDAAVLRTLIQTASTIETLPQEPAVYRGLERLLSANIAREVSDRRKRCVMSVLVAQQTGLNMDQIAQVSKNSSDKGVAWALTLGST